MATAQKYSFKWRSWKPTFRGLNWKSSSINRCLQLSSVNRCVTGLLLLCSLPPVRKFCWKTYHPHIPSWTFQSLGTCDWNLTGRWEHLDGLALWPVNESRFKTWYIYIWYIYICVYVYIPFTFDRRMKNHTFDALADQLENLQHTSLNSCQCTSWQPFG